MTVPSSENPAKYEAMVKVLLGATNKAEMERIALLYILDLSFPRGDICLAMKSVELEKGWR